MEPVYPELTSRPLTRAQRWANALVIVVALALLGVGFLIKDQVVAGTTVFEDLSAGIRAQYPANWLLDRDGDYIFRARNPESPGYRTTFQVAVEPIGEDAEARNILDNLTLARAQTLAAYGVLSTTDYTLPDAEAATRLEYVFVYTEPNPFLQSLPSVVYGIDIVSIKRGQAIIVTFRVEADRIEDEIWRLDQFLAALEF